MSISQIVITNTNITSLIREYIRDKSRLPEHLRDINNWDVSNVTKMDSLFKNTNFNEPLNDWDVSNVTNMSFMFQNAISFNQPLHKWDVRNVEDMTSMFENATSFNQPLNEWDVYKVEHMTSMFENATSFNQPLNKWIVDTVENMSSMFENATSFNQSLNKWDVFNVEYMHSMFKNATSFNQPLNNWEVHNVVDMTSMFENATSFNQPLQWNDRLPYVETMASMFKNATSFNQPLNNWIIQNVEDMTSMFENATSFNQPLNNWNVRTVISMSRMFYNATSFNQPLNNWVLGNVEMNDMFTGAIAFRYPPPRPQRQIRQYQHQGRAYEIHNAFHDLNMNQFISILSSNPSPTPTTPLFQPLIQYIQTSSSQEKEQTISNLTRIENAIMPTLQSNEDLLKYVFITIDYVSKQPPEFVNLYLKNFTFDCLNAYERNQSSCVKGMIERVFLIIRDVVATFCVEDGHPMCKEEYKKLLKTFYPEIDLNNLFQNWYIQYSEKDEIVAMNAEQRKEHFKHYVSEQLNNEAEYQRLSDKLETYIENNNEIFNTLILGGGKKTIKSNKKTTLISKMGRTRKTRTRKTRTRRTKTRRTKTRRTRTRTRRTREII